MTKNLGPLYYLQRATSICINFPQHSSPLLGSGANSEGATIDFWISENRDKKSAEKFFRKALKASHNQMPRVITTDKYYTYEVLINELIYSGRLSCNTQHRQIKYLNNIVEFHGRGNSHGFGLKSSGGLRWADLCQ